MIKLDTIQIASPCHADWNTMDGDDQVRFCSGCRKNVYNLSEMTRAEAEGLVNRLEGKLCVRFYTRPDGTALTSDCPVGLRAVRYRRLRKFSYAAAVVLSSAGGLLCGGSSVQAAETIIKTPKNPKLSIPLPSPALPRNTMGKLVTPKPANPNITFPTITFPERNPVATMGFMGRPVMGAPPISIVGPEPRPKTPKTKRPSAKTPDEKK